MHSLFNPTFYSFIYYYLHPNFILYYIMYTTNTSASFMSISFLHWTIKRAYFTTSTQHSIHFSADVEADTEVVWVCVVK